jgi:hypothetical protein
MRLSRRSYPYPVVGNVDDVPGAAFQAVIETSADKDNIYIDVNIQCSSTTIQKLVDEGRAAYLLHAECTNTVFRRAYQFKEPSKRIVISADQLNDLVELNVFAVAAAGLSGYRVDGMHPDYGAATFEVCKGDVLAKGDGYTFLVESTDTLGRIGTIMQIEGAPEEGDQPMRIEFGGNKILLILSKPDFKAYKEMRSSPTLYGILTTTIVLPALLDTVQFMDRKDEEELESLRWYQVLKHRIELLGVHHNEEPIVKVQKLLELPIKRALSTAYSLVEASS